jgi:diguanylate cyclase (GGDEF)-like protein
LKILRSNSLAVNITLVVLLGITVALCVFTTAMVEIDRRNSLAMLDNRLSILADMIGQHSTAALNFNDKEAAAEVLRALRKDPPIVSACLYDLSGSLFSEYNRDVNEMRCPSGRNATTQPTDRYRIVAHEVRRRSELVGSIYLVSDMRDLTAREHGLLLIAAFLAFLALVTGGISGSILQLRISKPIAGLARAMHEVTAGENLNARVKVRGSREIAELARGFNRMLAELEHRDQMTKEAEASLHSQARTDALTGLANRRSFTESLSLSIAMARRQRGFLGLLYIDLDGFKLVNDSLGHSVGDLFLCEVAARLSARVRASDLLARVGGDEFTVILRTLDQSKSAGLVADFLLDSLSKPFCIEGHEISIGASIGISTLNDSQADGIELLRQADSAMYAAKRAGRNRAMYFHADLENVALERLTLESQLRGALARGEIYVNYQPEFDVVSGRLVRFEALARWKHPQLGQVPPDKFIPVAEESGLIHGLGAYILEQACREAVCWQALTPDPIQVAVNISALQFNAESLVEDIFGALERSGLKSELLQLEFTESVMMGPLRVSLEKMTKLRALGVSLALDDFGTGFSCLSYLPDLPFNSIKIDQSFIKNLNSGSDSVTMLHSMIALAHSMGMRVIVEGIEDSFQLQICKELGADESQGYLLGFPSDNPAAKLIEQYKNCSDVAAQDYNFASVRN